MFSQKQELEFNVAFLAEMIQSTSAENDQWQEINSGYFNNVDKMAKFWNNPDWRPAHVVTMMAWTKKAVELLKNKLQQNELKLKELDSKRLPAEWAVLRFQQEKILHQMNDIQTSKTRLLCCDLKNRLLGPQDEFDSPPKRAVLKNGSKMMKKRKVSLCHVPIIRGNSYFRSKNQHLVVSVAKFWQNFCKEPRTFVTEMDSKTTSQKTLAFQFVQENWRMYTNTSKLRTLHHPVMKMVSKPKSRPNQRMRHRRYVHFN